MAEKPFEGTGLDRFMSNLPTRAVLTYGTCVPNPDPEKDCEDVTVCLSFAEKDYGFGDITIRQTSEGVFLDTERSSLERVKMYFALLIDNAITDTEQDPVKHALYNKVMSSACGEHCKMCHPVKP